MVGWFRDEGLVSDAPPVVAIAANAGNPHYLPTAERNQVIGTDEVLLLDLWGKKTTPGAVFADITWVGVTSTRVPAEPAAAFAAIVNARDTAVRPVYVHGFGQGLPAQHHTMVNYWCDDPLRGPAWTCAEQVYRRSDFRPHEIDVAQLYDAFTPLVLLSLEAYGFCKRGEAGAFSEGGALGPGGRLPVNTSGGGLSEAYVHGFNLINEGVRQLRGESVNQVAGAEACLVSGGEGVPTSAVILRR